MLLYLSMLLLVIGRLAVGFEKDLASRAEDRGAEESIAKQISN